MTIDIEKLAKDTLELVKENNDLSAYNYMISRLKHFAEAYAAKVLEDKEREIAELKTTVRSDNSKVIAALNANNNDLREALEDISNWTFGWDGDCGVTAVALQALSKTPAQSLQAFENEVNERCAKVCDEAGQPNKDEIHTDAQWAAKVMAANIRALKTNS